MVAEDLYVLERSVMYTVNSCVGEGGEEVLIVSNVAEDIKVLVSEDTIFFWPSVLGVAGGPSYSGLKGQ